MSEEPRRGWRATLPTEDKEMWLKHGVFFRHIHGVISLGGRANMLVDASCAYQVKHGTLFVAVAIANSQENSFSRKLGRIIAGHRLLGGRTAEPYSVTFYATDPIVESMMLAMDAESLDKAMCIPEFELFVMNYAIGIVRQRWYEPHKKKMAAIRDAKLGFATPSPEVVAKLEEALGQDGERLKAEL